MACHQLSHCLRTLFHLGSKNIWVAQSPSGNFSTSRFRKLHPICSLSTSPLKRGYCRAVSSANSVESEQVLHRNVLFDFPHSQIKSPNLDSSNGRVMLIDGTSIIYRAYYRLLAKLHHGHLSHADGDGDWILTIFTALSLIIDVLEFLPSHILVRVVSPDKDFFQILSPSLRLLRIAPRGFEMVSFGMEDFAGKYGGLKPSQFVDLISLTGDKSDNIPGVHGIGDVHAIQLIMKFGTLESLLERVEQVEEERIRKVLLSNAELARLSKDLAILRCDLPSYMVPFAPDDLIFEKPEDGGEKFTSLLTAISAYAEGFSADTIIRRALYLWKKLEKQNTYTVHQKLLSA